MPEQNREPFPGVPKNLTELLRGNYPGYQLKTGYSLELEDDEEENEDYKKFFPAVFRPPEERVVVTVDLDLLKKIWKTLPPRRSRIRSTLIYFNQETMIAFPIFGCSEAQMAESEPEKILSSDEFDTLIAADACPFQWLHGYIGQVISRQEFAKNIELEIKGHHAKLPISA